MRNQTSPHATTLRRNQTNAERRFWSAVRNRQLGGFKFRRQVSVGPFVVDFLCVAAGLVVELDCGQHDKVVDAGRTRFLEQRGLKVIRFWNNEVPGNLEGVLEVVHGVLVARVPC